MGTQKSGWMDGLAPRGGGGNGGIHHQQLTSLAIPGRALGEIRPANGALAAQSDPVVGAHGDVWVVFGPYKKKKANDQQHHHRRSGERHCVISGGNDWQKMEIDMQSRPLGAWCVETTQRESCRRGILVACR